MKSGLQNKPPSKSSQQPTSHIKKPSEEDRNTSAKDTEKFPSNFSSSDIRNRAARRSLSGVPLTCLFETKFKHFKRLQQSERESRGLNFLLAPSSRAIYRSSMPVTPICTPLINRSLPFTEQTLQNKILQTHRTFHAGAFDSLKIQEENEPKGSMEDVLDSRHHNQDSSGKQTSSKPK